MIVDTKYVGLLSMRLKNFKKKSNNTWNCSCPICGDSKKDSRKARGYFLPYKGHLIYKCHNCGISTSFSNFLKRFDEDLHKEYRMERFGSKYRTAKKKPEIIVPTMQTEDRIKTIRDNFSVLDDLVPFQDMPEVHKKYLMSRRIPIEHLNKYFYFTEKFKTYSNGVCPGSFSKSSLAYDEARIIVVMFDEDDTVIGFQGREIEKSYAKYVTIKLDKDDKKIFGLDRIDPRKPVRVVEGPIDSLFISNCIAVCGADLLSQSDGLFKRRVLIYDNEPRSKIACNKIEQAIVKGIPVVIFPSHISKKDVNDMVMNGVMIEKVIMDCTYEKLKARMEFSRWCKC